MNMKKKPWAHTKEKLPVWEIHQIVSSMTFANLLAWKIIGLGF